MISSLRSKGVIDKNNSIVKGLIPNIKGKNFKLVFNFNIKDEAGQETVSDSEKSNEQV